MRKQIKSCLRARKSSTVILTLGAACATTAGIGQVASGMELPSLQVAPAGKRRTVHRTKPVHHKPARMHTRFDAASRDRDVLVGHRLAFRGSLEPAHKGRPVLLQVRRDHRWSTVARSLTGAQGRYRLHYSPQASGRVAVRVRFAGDSASLPVSRKVGELSVFRLAVASWYASGGYPACGGVLTSSTLGVANKTLPCGTMVTLRYHGRSLRVPVIDRGPYVEGREFDLTEATKEALGFEGVGVVETIVS